MMDVQTWVSGDCDTDVAVEHTSARVEVNPNGRAYDRREFWILDATLTLPVGIRRQHKQLRKRGEHRRDLWRSDAYELPPPSPKERTRDASIVPQLAKNLRVEPSVKRLRVDAHAPQNLSDIVPRSYRRDLDPQLGASATR